MAFDREKIEFSTQDLISHINTSGLASPNRFWVSFTLPKGVSSSGANDNSIGVDPLAKSGASNEFQTTIGDIGIACESMEFPERTFTTTEHRHVGPVFKTPINSQYSDVSFSFRLSSDFRERKYFEIWQSMASNLELNSFNFYDEYVSTIHLFQLNKQNEVTYQVSLFEAFPVSIGAIQNSFSSNNEVSKCTVSMSYRYWTRQE